MRDSGAVVTASPVTPNAWRLSQVNEAVRRLLLDGRIYFQDEASQLVAHLVQPEAEEQMLDVCAAPGSKATHLAAIVPRAMIAAGDLYEHRVRTMKELADRQGATLSFVVYDAGESLPFASGGFDNVLVDAPCSGTGTLRHNPEIRWRLEARDIPQLVDRQRRILVNAAALVRSGGRLVYSTCSLEPDENETVINEFLDHQRDFRLLALESFEELQTPGGAIRTWPQRDDVDGFFVTVLRRQ
jgi:16S rRNA (cytosine967-C5)-methyltransferase